MTNVTSKHVIIIVMSVLIGASLVIAISMLPVFGSTNGAIMDNITRAKIITEEDLSISLYIERNNETEKLDIDTLPYLNKEVQKLNVQLDRLIVTLEKINGLLENTKPKSLMFNDTFARS